MRGEKSGDNRKYFDIKSSSTFSTILGQSVKIIVEYQGSINENAVGRN